MKRLILLAPLLLPAPLLLAQVGQPCDDSWMSALTASGGSGGLAPGAHDVTLAGYPARIVVGDGYDPSTPTFLAWYLHGDGGGYDTRGMDAFIDEMDWVYVAPQAPPGVNDPDLYPWDGRDGGSQAANLAQIKAVLDHMIANYNVYTNFHFGAGASGGSWFYDFYGPSFADYPSYFNLNCGASQRSSAPAPDPVVAANSEFHYTIGTDDFLFPGALTSVPAYEAAGYQVGTDFRLGVGHCAFNTGAATVAYWREVLQRRAGCCTIRLRNRFDTYPDYPGAVASYDLDIDTESTCGWTATVDAAWITLSTGAGTGDATVQYGLAANDTGARRTGRIQVGDKWIDVRQNPADDAYEENDALDQTHDLRGSPGQRLSDLMGPGVQCDRDTYTLSAPAGELQVRIFLEHTHAEGDLNIFLYDTANVRVDYSFSGTDNEFLAVTVPAAGDYNLSVSKGGGGANCQRYDLWWDHAPTNCSYALSAPGADVPAAGVSGDVDLTAPAGCDWTVLSPTWITIDSAATGSGDATIAYTVAANPGAQPRSGTILVAGEPFTVTQAGGVVVAKPDLVLGNLGVTVYAPNRVTVTGVVRNVGALAADVENIVWQTYVADETGSRPSGGSQWRPGVPPLAPGASTPIEFTIGPSGGVDNDLFLDVVIDYSDIIDESDESNNRSRILLPPHIIVAEWLGPNLRVDTKGVAGESYRIDECLDLPGGVWTPFAGLPAQTAATDGESLRFTVPHTAARRYLRVARE